MSDPRLTRAARLAACLAGAVLLSSSACIHGTVPARELYRLALPDSLSPSREGATAAAVPAAPLAGTVAIGTWRAPGLYGDRSIVYRTNDTEYGAYPSREWAIPLGEQLGVFTDAVLRRLPIAGGGAIYDPPSPRANTFLWRGTIREMEEVDRGRAVFAAVRLEASLVRVADDSVLWQGAVRLEAPVRDGTRMSSIVETLSALTAQGVTQLVVDARTALGARQEAGVVSRP